ncbi:hypothetical protein [Paludisphaera sp.]|uniref:hypothetical protein n=1 Tax=Paludisphaera sp. TaxID=2017432 RepID=UPI00301E26AE
MFSRREWKDAVLASTLVLLCCAPLGCGETPPASPPTPDPAATPTAEEPVKAAKGKRKGNPDQDMGIAEKREMRRKAEAAGGAP